MANPFYGTLTSTAAPQLGLSSVFGANNQIAPTSIVVSVVLASASAATYSIQYTLDDLQGNFGATTPTWFDSASASSITASTTLTITFPVMGLRISASTIPGTVSPQLTYRILQAGIVN